MNIDISVEDPRLPDVRELLATHLAFAHGVTPREFSFALDVEQLTHPSVTFFSARRDGLLLGIAALKRLDQHDVELKSMHTRKPARKQGVGRALVEHLVQFARAHGYRVMYLETGTTDDYAAARRLYASAGFRPCRSFGDYRASPHNTFKSLALTHEGPVQP